MSETPSEPPDGKHPRPVLLAWAIAATVTAVVCVSTTLFVVLNMREPPNDTSATPPPDSTNSPTAHALLAHWTFDETSGAIAHDSRGSVVGILGGGARFVARGISGNALSLDQASGSLVNMGNSFRPFTEGDFSVVAWVKTTTTADGAILLSKHEGGTLNGCLFGLNRDSTYGQPGKAYFYASTLGGGEVVSAATVNDGQWHQIVGVYATGGNIQIYVDGAPAGSAKASQPIVQNSAPFLVGGFSQSGTPTSSFTGLVDDVRIYTMALSSADVQRLFQHPDRF